MRLQQCISRLWREEYLDAPYRLGGLTRQEGYDCLSLVYTMLCRLGANVKPYWRDLDITNYWVDYDLELLPDWVRSLGEEVGIDYRRPGDVLLCRLRNGQWLSSIYLGGETCAVVNGEIGRVAACPFGLLKPWVVEARRCLF